MACAHSAARWPTGGCRLSASALSRMATRTARFVPERRAQWNRDASCPGDALNGRRAVALFGEELTGRRHDPPPGDSGRRRATVELYCRGIFIRLSLYRIWSDRARRLIACTDPVCGVCRPVWPGPRCWSLKRGCWCRGESSLKLEPRRLTLCSCCPRDAGMRWWRGVTPAVGLFALPALVTTR